MEDNFLQGLEELSKEPSKPKNTKKIKRDLKTSKEEVESFVRSSEEQSVIEEELQKFEENINHIYLVLDSVNPLAIEDLEERMKVLKLKIDIQTKLPQLLKALEDLRTNAKNKAENIRGAKELSPLEQGLI